MASLDSMDLLIPFPLFLSSILTKESPAPDIGWGGGLELLRSGGKVAGDEEEEQLKEQLW